MFNLYDNPISHLVDFTRYTFLSGRFYQMIWYDRAGYLVDSTRLSGSSGQVNRLKKVPSALWTRGFIATSLLAVYSLSILIVILLQSVGWGYS